MFEECIKESKPWPSFAGSDDYQVVVTLQGEVQDPRFLRFLEKVGKEKLASFTTADFLFTISWVRKAYIPASGAWTGKLTRCCYLSMYRIIARRVADCRN
jgi:hypothetical protein